jgi:hypothetical protein
MIVEPFAHVSRTISIRGRVFYGASTFICTPASLSQEVALGLGAQAGERGAAEAREARLGRDLTQAARRDSIQYDL